MINYGGAARMLTGALCLLTRYLGSTLPYCSICDCDDSNQVKSFKKWRRRDDECYIKAKATPTARSNCEIPSILITPRHA